MDAVIFVRMILPQVHLRKPCYDFSILLSGSRPGGQALGGGSLRQNECFYQIRTANKRGKAGKAPRLGGQIAKNLQPPGLQ